METARRVAEATLDSVSQAVDDMASRFVEPTITGPGGASGPAFTVLSDVPRAVLFGDFGAGKTTFLQMFAHRSARDFLEGTKGAPCPIWLPARKIQTTTGFVWHETPSFAPLLAETDCILIVDGLDESVEPWRLALELARLLRKYPRLRALISSRPATHPAELAALPGYTLQVLDQRSVQEFVARFMDGDQAKAHRFLDRIYGYYDLQELVSRPLLLHMLLQLGDGFIDKPPQAWAVEWYQEQLAEVPFSNPVTTPALRSEILGELAATLFVQNTFSLPHKDWLDLLIKEYPDLDAQSVEKEIGALVFIRRNPDESIGFVHKTIEDLALSNHLWREPIRLLNLAESAPPARVDLLRSAAWLSDDVGPLVEGCMQRGWLLEAAICISASQAENGPLADFVAQRLRVVLGDRLVLRLAPLSTSAATSNAGTSDIKEHHDLLDLLDRASDPSASPQDRGRRLEDFAAALFANGFEVHDRNRLTAFGEFDLALEITGMTPFWLNFGGDSMVECKNRNGPSEVADINAFAAKVDLTGLKLAFFLSMNGFTRRALEELSRLALKESRPLLVPLTGEAVRRMLERRESIEEFFKRSIRNVRDQRLGRWE